MDELASQDGISKSCLSVAFQSQILYQPGPVGALGKSLILAAISGVLRPGNILERNASLNSAEYWLPYSVFGDSETVGTMERTGTMSSLVGTVPLEQRAAMRGGD
jgi:hypothetical protein